MLTYKNPNKILKFKYVHDFVAHFNKTFLLLLARQILSHTPMFD